MKFEYLPDSELEVMATDERNQALDDYAAEEARR